MKALVSPRFFALFFANVTVIIAVCVIFAASATRAGVSANGAEGNTVNYAVSPS